MRVYTFLDTHVHDGKVLLKLRFWNTIQQGRFFYDLKLTRKSGPVPERLNSQLEGIWPGCVRVADKFQ